MRSGVIARAKAYVETWHRSLVVAVATLVEEYVVLCYVGRHNCDVPPPLLRGERLPDTRTRSETVDAETAWALLQKCEKVHGVCVRNVLRCKDDEDAYNGFLELT